MVALPMVGWHSTPPPIPVRSSWNEMMPCAHRGVVRATKPEFTIWLCELHKQSCVQLAQHVPLLPGASVIDCQTCGDYRGEALSKRPQCNHRGEILRRDVGNLCGSVGDQVTIYQCGLHGECSERRYCERQTAVSCVTCNDYSPPAGVPEIAS